MLGPLPGGIEGACRPLLIGAVAAFIVLAACSPRLSPASDGAKAARAAGTSRGAQASGAKRAAGGTQTVGSGEQASGAHGAAGALPGGSQSAAVDRNASAGTRPTGAYVSFLRGSVTLRAPGSAADSASRVRVADPVDGDDTIATSKSSAAEVKIAGMFDVGLGEQTSVRFDTVPPATPGAGQGAVRLVLFLKQGSLQIKAGASLLSGATSPKPGASERAASLLLEVHTPNLFVSSRGGSLLVTETPDSTLCAVGVGEAWLLPQSVVYSDLVDGISDRREVELLDGILSKAVPVARHQEVRVPSTRLAKIGKLGAAIRAILVKTKGQSSIPKSTEESLSTLTSEAKNEVTAAIGAPEPISKALRSELDPSSIHHRRMKTVSSSEKPTSPQGSAGSTESSTTTSSATGLAPKPSTANGASSTGDQQATPEGSTPTQAASPSPIDSTSGGGTSGAAASGATSGGFPGPTPPTPPTPPKVP